jgi:hypothetical protein
MLVTAAFLASMSGGTFTADTGMSWWQTLGGLAVVFGLLLVSLKLLGRWNRRTGAAESSLLTVWPLGPKKEIQVLRLEDQVHYIYRHDGAMVVLQTERLTDFENKRNHVPSGKPVAGWRDTLTGNLPFWNGSGKTVLTAKNASTDPLRG